MFIASNGRWEGRLVAGGVTWHLDLTNAPLWSPPPVPNYDAFQQHFSAAAELPFEGTPGLSIDRALKFDWMLVELLLLIWPISVVLGLLYRAVRGERRDLILHLALAVGVGLTCGAAACMGLWFIGGGWGPPLPAAFGGMALILSLVIGLLSYCLPNSVAGACPCCGPAGVIPNAAHCPECGRTTPR